MNGNKKFTEFVATLDYIEVCRVTIAPDGTFSVPSEKEGRIAEVSAGTRRALARFCREFADRLDAGAQSVRRARSSTKRRKQKE